MTALRSLTLLLATLGGIACNATSGTERMDTLLGATWEATRIGDTPVNTPTPVTLAIADGQLSGHSGCNRYSARVTVSEGRLTIGPIMSTRMACMNDGAMQVEASLLKALAAAERWTVAADGSLEIAGRAGTIVFRAVAGPR
jgi:putative lipoprotein